MTSSLSTKRQRSGNQRREKALAIEPALPTRRLPSIEEVLNQTRFFGEHDHMIQYGKAFYKRKILTPKIMNFPFFAQSGWTHYFGTKSLKKLNIVNVNGVWHHGGANEDDEQQPEEDIEHEEASVPDHRVEDSRPQPPIQHDAQMLSQIWGGIQHLQEGLANLNLTVTTGFDRVTERINRLEERFDTFQDSFK
ncbi:uncharacterized protein LOC108343552 isoform X4 [Vigna angularis]|uniref:uncharacterized protein LOC108343552 isoform X4 n=1 Tax=Phaseolus angularis TaxID=3914 RepID=UPI0022B3102F|nr:uncharacterized protein LOC108343552 isoform X4 [Vigna angularis]